MSQSKEYGATSLSSDNSGSTLDKAWDVTKKVALGGAATALGLGAVAGVKHFFARGAQATTENGARGICGGSSNSGLF